MTISSLDSSGAQARLDTYVGQLHVTLSGSRFTLHGFQNGAAVSLALGDVNLHAIMDHVGWKSSRTALHYNKLKQVLNPAGPATRLADLELQTGKDYKGANDLSGFVPVFLIINAGHLICWFCMFQHNLNIICSCCLEVLLTDVHCNNRLITALLYQHGS